MYMPMYFDKTLVVLLPAILLSMYASYKVNSTTKKYFGVRAMKGMTGQEVARRILDSNGLNNVPIYAVPGNLTDHYDPRRRTVSLSEEVFYGTSISSVSIAAHECGHAIHHSKLYAPMMFRSAIVPVVNFASSASWIIIMMGFFVSNSFLWIGILLFTATVLFQIITLPVEFNASSRALAQLENLGILGLDEKKEGSKVLSAAALAYVATELASILQLVRLVVIARDRD